MNRHSDFSLHKDPQRGPRYRSSDDIWWSDELKRWMISDPELVLQVLRDPNFVVHEYRFDLALDRLGLKLPHLARMRDFLPLAVEGEQHIILRNRMTKDISANTPAAIEVYEAALSAALKENIEKNAKGRICLAQDIFLPSLQKASIALAGLSGCMNSIDLIDGLVDLSLFFDDISIKKRTQLDGVASKVLHAIPDDLSIDEKYLRLSIITLSINTLSASVLLSVKAILEREPGVALNRINWDAELNSTGLPFIERRALERTRLAQQPILPNERVRLFVDAAGFRGDVCPHYSDLYFAAGAHQCIGKAASRKIWKSTVDQLRLINRSLKVTGFSFRTRDSVFSLLESLEVDIHD